MSFKTTQLREIKREIFLLSYKKFSDYWTDFDVSVGSIFIYLFLEFPMFCDPNASWKTIYVFSFSIKPYMLNLSQKYFCSKHINYIVLRVFPHSTIQGACGIHTQTQLRMTK